MKRLSIIAALIVLTLGLCQNGMATTFINGAIDTSTSPWQMTTVNNGAAYDYLINRTDSFNLAPGTAPQTIYGTVSNLSFGSTSSWLEIGFVSKTRAELAIDDYSHPPYMFNESAFFLVSKNSSGDILVAPADYNNHGGTSFNLGPVTQFDYALQITPNASGAGGKITVTVGSSSSYTHYGVDNTMAAYGDTSNYEFLYDAYLGVSNTAGYVIAQGWTENLNGSGAGGFARATVTAAPTPVPGTVLLLGSGLMGLVVWGRRRLAAKS